MTDKSQDKNEEIIFFDHFGRDGGYDRFHEQSYGTLFNILNRRVKPKNGDTIVDFGCGTGAFTSRLAKRYPESKITGIDICPSSINLASQAGSKAHFMVGDVENTRLPSNSVDIVSCFGLLHHFPDFSLVADEIGRILKPGGRFFAFDPHHNNPIFWLFRAKASPLYNPIGVTKNERLLSRGEVVRVFSRVGIATDTTVMGGLKFIRMDGKLMTKLMPAYNLFDTAFSYTPFARLFGPWLISWGVKS